jgi:hypothetical protein
MNILFFCADFSSSSSSPVFHFDYENEDDDEGDLVPTSRVSTFSL